MDVKTKVKVLEYKRAYYRKNRLLLNAKHRANLKTIQHTSKGKWYDYRSSAKKRGIPFDLTYEEFDVITRMPCQYCGLKGYGVDREDNLVGYTIGNSVPCCMMCNRMKNDFNLDAFLEQCKSIVANLGRYGR